MEGIIFPVPCLKANLPRDLAQRGRCSQWNLGPISARPAALATNWKMVINDYLMIFDSQWALPPLVGGPSEGMQASTRDARRSREQMRWVVDVLMLTATSNKGGCLLTPMKRATTDLRRRSMQAQKLRIEPAHVTNLAFLAYGRHEVRY